jgi:FixJ family two-component response regulator
MNEVSRGHFKNNSADSGSIAHRERSCAAIAQCNATGNGSMDPKLPGFQSTIGVLVSQASPVVSIVDDDRSFLTAVSRLLCVAGYSVKAYSSAEEFLAQITDAPGCVIVDLRMHGISGLDLQRALAGKAHACPVIFLSAAGDIPSSVKAMRLGAEDFLTKDAPKEDLLEAVERALARDALQRVQRIQLQELRDRFTALTPREYEVLQHVVGGQLNKQIASDLGISERTVKLHRTAMTVKLRVRSVAQLVRLLQEARIP